MITNQKKLYLSIKKYFISNIKEFKMSEILNLTAKITISIKGGREQSVSYDNFNLSKLNIIVIDAVSCLCSKSVKSIKIEVSIHLKNKIRVSLSEFIRSEDIEFVKSIEWDALVENEAYSTNILGKRKDNRKLIKFIKYAEEK